MKTHKFKWLPILGLALIFNLFTSCDEDSETLSSIVEIATGDDDFSTLVEALQKAGLVSALEGDGPFTVFAPTNAAFKTLLSDNGFSSLDDIDSASLASILLYHVVNGKVLSTDLSNGYVETLNSTGPSDSKVKLLVNIDDGVMLNGASEVTSANIEATNGVIHVINKVLSVPNVVDIATNNSNFSSLVTALTRDGNTYTNLLNGDGPFTVFAPTNEAFTALLASNNDWTTLADIPSATLDAVLQYHVVNNANVLSSSLTDEMNVSTFGGNDFTVDLTNGPQIKTGSSQTVNITVTDVQGSNGIVHVVDAVLVP